MKICYLADGKSIHVRKLCDYFIRQGHEVHLITFQDVALPGVTVHFMDAGPICVEGGNWKVLLKAFEIRKKINEINPHLVHAIYSTSYGIVGALSGFHPFVVTPLGSDVLISARDSKLYKWLIRFVFSKADHVTSMAHHMSNAIHRIGIEDAKLGEFIFGINTDLFHCPDEPLGSDRFVITSSRNFEPVYNIPSLVDAIFLVKDKIPNLQVNLFGDGSKRPCIEKMIYEKGLKHIIHLKGAVPQADLAKALQQSHIYISSSVSDGSSLSLLEAMASGSFPIATDIPANREWIRNGENGLLITANNARELADKIIYAHRNYSTLSQKAIGLNKALIREKGSFHENTTAMERKYLALLRMAEARAHKRFPQTAL